jgi:hypothetical protein
MLEMLCFQKVKSQAFDGVCAGIVFRVEKGAFHQDVVFTGRLDPSDYGFDTNHPLCIQIWTEILQSARS